MTGLNKLVKAIHALKGYGIATNASASEMILHKAGVFYDLEITVHPGRRLSLEEVQTRLKKE